MKKRWLFYKPETGIGTQIADCYEDEAADLSVALGCEKIAVEQDVTDATHYVKDDAVVPIPEKPSTYHQWDWASLSWTVGEKEMALAKKAVIAEVTKIRDQLLAAPIEFDGILFDADAFSLSNMTGVISRIERGDGLTAGWSGWRVADNSMVWADATADQVLIKLKSIAGLIENRTQAILNASWQHKDAIGALTTLTDILSYDASLLWSN